MKKCLPAIPFIFALLLCGCAPISPSNLPAVASGGSVQATSTPTGSPAGQAAVTGSAAAPSPAPPARTPDPESEMLVAGVVTKVLESAVQVRDDSLGMELAVTELDKAEYAGGVSREFKAGNYVRIITSNKLAKTMPERAAAHFVLENSSQ